jgi:hypothetical protein
MQFMHLETLAWTSFTNMEQSAKSYNNLATTLGEEEFLEKKIYAKKPSFSPFFLASLINPCLCFASAPIVLQNSVITCICHFIKLAPTINQSTLYY